MSDMINNKKVKEFFYANGEGSGQWDDKEFFQEHVDCGDRSEWYVVVRETGTGKELERWNMRILEGVIYA